MNCHNHCYKDGKLASFTAGHRHKVHDDGFTVTNGPLISPDSKYLYFSDTLSGIVYRYSFQLTSGEISDRQVFLSFKKDQGLPDGMCFDIEGNIWIAMWGAGKVICVSPAGELLCEFGVSAPNVTNVCFCGIELDRLLVSTASTGMSKVTAERYPLSGCLFEIVDHGTRGFTSFPVKLS
jgi:sugar lactone lactonase YvrE